MRPFILINFSIFNSFSNKKNYLFTYDYLFGLFPKNYSNYPFKKNSLAFYNNMPLNDRTTYSYNQMPLYKKELIPYMTRLFDITLNHFKSKNKHLNTQI